MLLVLRLPVEGDKYGILLFCNPYQRERESRQRVTPFSCPPPFSGLQPAAGVSRVVVDLQSRNGFDKTGPYRARFILEALADLKARLREAASDLVVRIGKPGGFVLCGSKQWQA